MGTYTTETAGNSDEVVPLAIPEWMLVQNLFIIAYGNLQGKSVS